MRMTLRLLESAASFRAFLSKVAPGERVAGRRPAGIRRSFARAAALFCATIVAWSGIACQAQEDNAPLEEGELLLLGAGYILLSSPYQRVTADSGSITINLKSGGSRSYNYSPFCTDVPDNRTFYFFVKPGDPQKILLNFMGGGACWDGKNCFGDNTVTYFNRLNLLPDQFVNVAFNGVMGDAASNPFSGWTTIFVPYCSGDTHWGSKDVSYVNPKTGASATIRHRGFDNFLAVLAHMRSEYQPQQIFVTGQSAGGYGTVLTFPFVRESFPSARVDMLGDAASGVITSGFNTTIINNWGIDRTIPDWVTGVDSTSIATLSLGDIYKNVGDFYNESNFSPGSRLGQYTAAYDGNQRYFFNIMKLIDAGKAYEDTSSMWGPGNGSQVSDSVNCEWYNTMIAERDKANAATNFNYYIAPGDVHTITTSDNMYDVSSNGTNFNSWLTSMAGDGAAWSDVMCANCNPPATLESPGGLSCP